MAAAVVARGEGVEAVPRGQQERLHLAVREAAHERGHGDALGVEERLDVELALAEQLDRAAVLAEALEQLAALVLVEAHDAVVLSLAFEPRGRDVDAMRAVHGLVHEIMRVRGMMTSPLPEARPLAWTARRGTEFERHERMAPSSGQQPYDGRDGRDGGKFLRPIAPVATFVRLLRGNGG